MYDKKTLERFKNPKNAGEIKNPTTWGEIGNVVCGDIIRVNLKVEKNIIKDIKFETYGCIAAIASSDYLCDIAKGKTIEEAEKITHKMILDRLGKIPPTKVHCSIMGIQALQTALKKYKKQKE